MKRILSLIVVLLIAGAAIATEPTLKQQILERLAELKQLAEGLPDEPVPDPDPDDPVEPDPDDPVDPDPDDPDPDVIENPPEAATTQAGTWSDPATFGNVKPGPGTHLTITHDVEVDTGTAGRVDLHARLKWVDGGTLDLHGSLVAWDGGIVEATTGRLSFHVPDDRLFIGNTAPGPIEDEPDFHPDDIGLWAMMGSDILLRGPKVTSFVRAVATGSPVPVAHGVSTRLAISAGSATLAEVPEGWQPGDVLLLAGELGQHKTVTLDSIDGTAITYTPRDDGLPAVFTASAVLFDDVEKWAPVVGNLSRRFVIDSPLVVEGDTNHRAHINIGHHGHFHVNNIEIQNLGPRAKLGRYPFHTHHAHGAHGDDITGCSIWQDVPAASDGSHRGNRTIVLHRTQGVTASQNVMLHSRGHAVFMEDQEEFGNVIADNVVVGAIGSNELPNRDPTSTGWDGAHGFWLRADNEISGNIAIGCTHGMAVFKQRDAAGQRIPSEQVQIRDTETVGCSQIGGWSEPDASWINHTSINNRFGHRGPPNGEHITLVDPVMLMNSAHEVSNYKHLAPMRIHGGIIAGRQVIRFHYAQHGIFEGTVIRANELVWNERAAWNLILRDCQVELNQVTRMVNSFFNSSQGLHPFNLVTFQSCTGTLHGKPFEVVTDVVPAWMPNHGHFAGEYLERDLWLASPLPESGAVVTDGLPGQHPDSEVTLTGADRVFTDGTTTSNGWENRREEWRGYTRGLPAGEYTIRARRLSGTVWETRKFTVVSGETVHWSDGELIEE